LQKYNIFQEKKEFSSDFIFDKQNWINFTDGFKQDNIKIH